LRGTPSKSGASSDFSTHWRVSHGRAAPGRRTYLGGELDRSFAQTERSSKTPSRSRFQSLGPTRPLSDPRTRSETFIETALVPDDRPTIEANSEAHLQNSGRQTIFRPTGGSVAVERPRPAEPTLAAAWAVVSPRKNEAGKRRPGAEFRVRMRRDR